MPAQFQLLGVHRAISAPSAPCREVAVFAYTRGERIVQRRLPCSPSNTIAFWQIRER